MKIRVPQTLEGAVAVGAKEMIVVLLDSKTLHNGSMYSSSVTTGDFEQFIAHDVVAYIDAHCRTVRNGAGLRRFLRVRFCIDPRLRFARPSNAGTGLLRLFSEKGESFLLALARGTAFASSSFATRTKLMRWRLLGQQD
jgi:hypothetical protein